MKMLPIAQTTPQVQFCAFMENTLPNPLNYDAQTLANNMVTGRMFVQAASANGLQTLTPLTYPAYQVSPAPAWTTVAGFRGKRVLPKLTLPYASAYADIVPQANAQYQLDIAIGTILNHRCASTSSAIMYATQAAGGTLPIPKQNADGTWPIAEYDFGADVTINSLTSLNQGSSGSHPFLASGVYMVFLQVLVGSTWTDVTNVTTNLTVAATNSEKFFTLPATVTGRKFRLVSKAAGWPFTLGIGLFSLHFYGDYVSGSSPRVLGKIQHAVLMTAASANVYSGVLSTNPYAVGWALGRLFPHIGFTVTDDLKQASVNDLFLTDATVYPGTEQTVGIISYAYKPIVLEAY